MPDRPSALWKAMPADQRVRVAEAFWLDRDSPEIEVQHAEAAQALAARLKFRVKSLLSLPAARRARQLAQLVDVSDAVAIRALVAYHFADRRALMGAFLDALGVAHEEGLITADEVAAPTTAALIGAIASLRNRFEAADIALYLKTLAALGDDTWVNMDEALGASPV